MSDEALYNNLKKIKTSLVDKEPIIEQSPFGFEKMSKVSKEAVRSVLAIYTESLYLLKTPEALDKIIEKFEPKAKALREEEEAAAKKALEESKKGRPTIPTKTAGVPEKEAPSYGGYGYDYGYDDYGYRAPYYSPGYTPRSEAYPPTKPTPAPAKEKKAAKEEAPSIVSAKEDPALKRLL